MEYLNLLISSLGMASFFVALWLLVVFFSDQLYYYEQGNSTKEHFEDLLPVLGCIILVIISLVDITYCYWKLYRVYFQWLMSLPLLICLCVFFYALAKSDDGVVEDASLWVAMMSFFFLGSSLAGQIALQNYSPKQGGLYLISFNVFWWIGMVVFSRCVMYWRAKNISKYLDVRIGWSKHEDGRVYFVLKNEKEALKFSKFISGDEFVRVIDAEVKVHRQSEDQKFGVGTVGFKRYV